MTVRSYKVSFIHRYTLLAGLIRHVPRAASERVGLRQPLGSHSICRIPPARVRSRSIHSSHTGIVSNELLSVNELFYRISKFQLEWAIQRINYMSGATNTGKSLKLAIEKGFQGARGGNIPKVAVVITDGQSQV